MEVVVVARGTWTVLALLDGRSHCQVLDFLETAEPIELGTRMLAVLEQSVRDSGPPKHNDEISKHLDGQVFEFRRGPKKGKKLRVVWFYGKPPDQRTVVCVEAFHKRENTPKGVIDRTEEIANQYSAAQKGRTLKVLPKDEWLRLKKASK